jgi:hypothetical protein
LSPDVEGLSSGGENCLPFLFDNDYRDGQTALTERLEMKKLLSRTLLGVAALAIPAGAAVAMTGTAFAGTPAGQGAQKVSLVAGGTAVCGAPGVVGGTVTPHSWVSTVLDGAGNVNTTVHLQDSTPNASYVVALYDQNCQPQHNLDGTNPVFSTDAQGNGTMSFTSHDPNGPITSAHVVLWNSDWSGYPYASPTVPVS